jgi:RHS repeat-associated protein
MKNILCGILFCLLVLCAQPAHAVTMTSGSTVTGTAPAAPPCLSNCFDTQTFTGTAGHGIVITAVGSWGTPSLDIRKPDGTSLTTGSGAIAYGSLPVSGTYTVRIASQVVGVGGGYTLYYVAGAEGVSNGALTSGATAHDSLPVGGLTSYTFSGTAGQGMQFRITAGGGTWDANVRVYTPNGTFYGAVNTNAFAIDSLPTTGNYTVIVQAAVATNGGSYDASYVIGGGAVSDGAITSGGFVSGNLPIGQMKSYSFSGTAGRSVVFSNGGMSWGTWMKIYKPDGSLWASSSAHTYASTSTTLPSTGTYSIVLWAQSYSSTGNFKMYFVQSGDSVSQTPVPFPSGAFDPSTMASGQLRSYAFDGVAGQAFTMHIGATYAMKILVYKPDFSYWTYSDTSVFPGNPATPLPTTGRYIVVAYPFNYTSTDPGDATFYTVKGNDTVSEGWLKNGKQRGGTMPLNGILSFKFNANASTSITFATSCPFGGVNGCYALLFRPDGTYWGYITNAGGTFTTPPASGEYTLVLYEYLGTHTGSYTVTVTTTQPAVTTTTPSKSKPQGCPVDLARIKASAKESTTPAASEGSSYSMVSSAAGNINGGTPFAGNPINFDLGYKWQTAVDYDAGGLSFVRIYRSDSTWTSNTVGTLWRHNYARTLTVPGSTASITDGTGATTAYTLSGSNWIPDDPSTTATLETITGGYKYTLADGTVEKYNSSKLLTRIEYQGGGALNLTYNGSNELTGIANENGRSLTLTYSSGRVATVVTPDGTFSYSYTSSKLTTVTKPDTKTIQYHYENATYTNALTGITDEKGVRWATYGYDANGKATSTQHAGGVDDYTIAFTANDTSTVTNPLGKDTKYYYTNLQGVRRIVQVDGVASTNCVASNKYYNYDTLGRMIGKTDWQDVVTRYEYDSRSNVTKIIEGAYTANQRVTTITWNNTFNLPDVITETGKTTDYDYDTYGRLTSETITDTATSETRITTYTYYSNTTDGSGNTILGRLQTVNGPRTDVTDTTTYAYDANFDLTTITNALSQVTTVTLRDSAGRPTRVTDPNGTETRIAYNSHGLVTSVIQAYGTALAATTSFSYDDNGNLTQVTLPNSVTVQYFYDNAQRLNKIQDALGNTVNYTLDDDGNVTQVQYKNATPTTTYTHTATFDELSRLLHSVGASSQTASFAWDKNSNLTTYTDPRTNATGYTYDALQRLKTSTNALSGVMTLGYGTRDLTSVQDQRSNTTTYTYNAFGDVTGETSPDRGTLSYTVDKAGNITQRTDANSVVTNFTYDAIDRPLTFAYPSDTSLNATLTYDSSSGCGTPYKGHLCSLTDAAGSTTYQYDVLGRVTQQTDTRSSLNFTTSYTYDLAGNIATITLPSGRVVTYTRNSNSFVSGVSATVNGSSTTLASSITYLPFGPLNALTYGNSLTFSATFDTDYYLTNRTVSGSIYNQTYTADANGNITQAGTTTYGYDALNRVNAENPGSSTSYTYDATSNRLTKVQGGTTSTTVPSTSNKISAVGGTSYTYDAAGNITAIGSNSYVWSAAGLMKEYKISGVTTGTYTYNAYAQRAKKVASSTTTYYVYGANGLLYGEYNSSGALVREYVYLNDAPLAQITAGSPETLIYLHTDHLGTPRFATNTGGTQVWAWTNDAFGTSTPAGSATVNLRMPGQYFDSESGLFYNWNRYYYPAIGRYISSDPIGIDGGLNTFNYANVSPVMFVDLEGLHDQDKWYGFNDKEFQRWFHRCWKRKGDADADKEGIEEAHEEWVKRGKPTGGKCYNGPSPEPSPEPSPRTTCGDNCKKQVAIVVAAGGTTYVIYRCIRMLPSLVVPPLWPTIPLNAAVP